MKLLSLTLLCILCFMSLKSQDQIILNNGDEIESKVAEITPEYIKYKRFDHLDGPVISLKKESIFLIRYENGRKEIINALPMPAAPAAVTPSQVAVTTTPATTAAPTAAAPVEQPATSAPATVIEPPKTATTSASKHNSGNFLAEDQFTVMGGLTVPLDGENMGFSLGLERTHYFSKHFGIMAHLSGSFIPSGRYDYYSGGEDLNLFFETGIQARSRSGQVQPYAALLIGTTLNPSSSEFWGYAASLGVGFLINDQIDIGARLHADVDNEYVRLQVGAGYRF